MNKIPVEIAKILLELMRFLVNQNLSEILLT